MIASCMPVFANRNGRNKAGSKDAAVPSLLTQLTVKLCNQLWSQTCKAIFVTIPTCTVLLSHLPTKVNLHT